MSIENKIANAKTVDIFSLLSQEEKMEADLLADISIQIHTRRIEMEMTQEEFAKFNNVTQTMVSKWESGEYNFTVQTLAKVFSRIGLSFTFDVGEKKAAFAAVHAASEIIQIDQWKTQTTSSGTWNRKSASRAVYIAAL